MNDNHDDQQPVVFTLTRFFITVGTVAALGGLISVLGALGVL